MFVEVLLEEEIDMLICNLFEKSITFGSNNPTIGIFPSLLQCPTIMCEHSGSAHCIMPFRRRYIWSQSGQK
jgi:hypothetical protein